MSRCKHPVGVQVGLADDLDWCSSCGAWRETGKSWVRPDTEMHVLAPGEHLIIEIDPAIPFSTIEDFRDAVPAKLAERTVMVAGKVHILGDAPENKRG